MNEIIENLYLSGVDAASDESLLVANDIKRIVSIGVESKPHLLIKQLAFPTILDSPDVSLVGTIRQCLPFIEEGINSGDNVLVHCIYGQSRSVSIIAAFMILHRNFTLNDALETIKSKRSTICINPGFLCQLMCLSLAHGLNTSYLRMIEWNETRSLDCETDESGTDEEAAWTYNCKACQGTLFTSTDILTDLSFDPFLATHLDEFWKGFRATFSDRPRALPVPGHTAVAPVPWIARQLPGAQCASTQGSTKKPRLLVSNAHANDGVENCLSCPNCGVNCGYFEKRGLLFCGGYMALDLFAIRDTSFRRRRIIK